MNVMERCAKHGRLNPRGSPLGCPSRTCSIHRQLPHAWTAGSGALHRGLHLATKASDASGGDRLTSEEEAFFSEVLARKREERQRGIREAAKRSKMYAERRKLEALKEQVDKPQAVSPSAPRPRPPPGATASDAAPSLLQRPAPPQLQPTPAKIAPSQPAPPTQAVQLPRPTATPSQPFKRRHAGLPKGIRPRTSSVMLRKRSSVSRYQADDDDDDEDDDEDMDADTLAALEAYASQLLGSPPSATSKSPASQPAAPASKQAPAAAPAALVRQAQRPQQRLPAAAAAEQDAEAKLMQKLQAIIDADSDSDDDDDDGTPRLPDLVNMDDIDWDALEAYEAIEASSSSQDTYTPAMPLTTTGAVKQWEEQRALNRPARPAGNQTRTSSTQATQSTPGQAGAATSLSTSTTSTSPTKGSSQAGAAVPVRGGDDESLDVQSLLSMLDELEAGGPQAREAGRQGRAGEAATVEAWEEMLLGKDWQDREFGDLTRQLSSLQGGGDEAYEDSGSPPWADEVTSLLTGLVLMSAKRYLKQELLPEGVEEEERATQVWEAPWALLVLDDSKQACLEYGNKQALNVLGITDFVDVYDLTMYDLLSPDVDDQQDWLWALSEVEDNGVTQAVVPTVKLLPRTASQDTSGGGVQPGQIITAKNVQLFRIDSLDEGPIGTAVLIKEWA